MPTDACDPVNSAGVWANWGIDHRSATLRVPARRGPATRIEHRLPEGAANLYVAVAPCSRPLASGCRPSAALDALESGAAFGDALERELVDNFVCVKRDEWQNFCDAVTDWELAHHLPFT